MKRKDALTRILETYIPRPRHGHAFRFHVRPGFYNLEKGYFGEDTMPNPDPIGRPNDEIYVLRNEHVDKIKSIIENFWADEDFYKQKKMLHKSVMAIQGPPGSGKTSLLTQVTEDLVKKNHVVFMARSPWSLRESIKNFRNIHATWPLTVIIEDLDEITKSYGEHDFIQLFDGVDTPNHTQFICTTNNIEDLSHKMLRRGRIDKIVQLPYPTIEERQFYLEKKIGDVAPMRDIIKIAAMTENCSFGHLKNLITDVYCYDIPLTQAIKEMRENDKISKKNSLEEDSSDLGIVYKKVNRG